MKKLIIVLIVCVLLAIVYSAVAQQPIHYNDGNVPTVTTVTDDSAGLELPGTFKAFAQHGLLGLMIFLLFKFVIEPLVTGTREANERLARSIDTLNSTMQNHAQSVSNEIRKELDGIGALIKSENEELYKRLCEKLEHLKNLS